MVRIINGRKIGAIACGVALLFSSCKPNGGLNGQNDQDKGDLPKYEQTLGGSIQLMSNNVPTQSENGLNFIPDVEVKYDNSPQDPTGKDTALGYPKVNLSGYYTDEVFIYNLNVMDYGAKADGKTDDTAAIQKAVNQAKTCGGTVYIPAGTYRIDGTVTVPHGITVRGDFRGPNDTQAPGNGTILHIYGGKGDLKATSPFVLGVGSGIVGVTIYYPEQNYEDVVKYPHTVDINFPLKTYEGDCVTIQDVWFVNSYMIADLGLESNNGIHYVKNVYGSPLHRGLELDNCYDVGRIEKVYFTPTYLLKAHDLGISNKLSLSQYNAAKDYMFNNSMGIVINKSDWEYTYDYNAEGLFAGVYMTKRSSGPSNCQFSHMTIVDCKSGMLIDEVNPIGLSVSNSYFSAGEGEDAHAVSTKNNLRKGVIKFNNCTFVGKDDAAVKINNAMNFSFVHCEVVSEKDQPGIQNTNAAVVQILECDFKGTGAPVDINDKIKRLQLLGSTFENKNGIKIDKDNPVSITVNDTKLDLPKQSGAAHQYKKTLPRPTTNHVYYVLNYGARQNQDSTQAFKDALEAAGKTGGTVYIPVGKYILKDSITVPEGVELRGSLDNQFHPKEFIGTTIVADVPAGEDKGALIKLSKNSGVAGFSVHYPNQFINDKIVAYDWTIQGLGEGVWAKNICLMNSYKGIDFATNPSDNHYIHFVSGAPIKEGVYVGSNNQNGWVENVQFNGHYGSSNKDYKEKASYDWLLMDTRLKVGTSFKFGYNKASHVLGNFSYGINVGAAFVEQNSQSFNGIVIGMGIDNSEIGFDIHQVDTAELINSQITIIKQSNDMKYVNVRDTNKGNVRLISGELYGHSVEQSTPCFSIGGAGKVGVQHFFFLGSSDIGFDLKGGDINLSANIFEDSITQANVGAGVNSAKIIATLCNPKQGIELKPGVEYLTINNNAGEKLISIFSGLR